MVVTVVVRIEKIVNGVISFLPENSSFYTRDPISGGHEPTPPTSQNESYLHPVVKFID
jgi:hypothetical protein